MLNERLRSGCEAFSSFILYVKRRLLLNAWIGNCVKAYALAWCGYAQIDGFTMEKLQDNMQFDIIAIRNIQISYSHFIAACKLFSCGSNQYMLFWLLKDA